MELDKMKQHKQFKKFINSLNSVECETFSFIFALVKIIRLNFGDNNVVFVF